MAEAYEALAVLQLFAPTANVCRCVVGCGAGMSAGHIPLPTSSIPWAS